MNDLHTIELVNDEAEVQGYDATSLAVFATVMSAANATLLAGMPKQLDAAKVQGINEGFDAGFNFGKGTDCGKPRR
jgi:hypothetical protein